MKNKKEIGFLGGGVSEMWLKEIGIFSLKDVQKIGVVEVYLALRSVNPKVTLNLLWGLQAKILGIHYLDLPQEIKEQLKAEVKRKIKRE